MLSALSKVVDPDLHRNIVELGFIKDLQIKAGKVSFSVELTTPACPVKELLKKQCEDVVGNIPGVTQVDVTMTAVTRGPKISSPTQNKSIEQVKNIIAVASGKGGVGKSTTAVNLAFALASSGSKVGILDADVYGPSIPIMTKVGNPSRSIGDLVEPPMVRGIKMVSVSMFGTGNKAAILRGPMAAQIIKQFLSQVHWGELDYLIIDYPPGTGDIQLTISQLVSLSGAVVVTTPQEVALTDVRKAVQMFETLKVPILGVIETMSYFVCDGCDKKHAIFREGGGKRISGEFGLPLLGEIPLDPRVAKDSDEGIPVVLSETGLAASAYHTAAGHVASQISILNLKDTKALESFSFKWN